MSHGWGPLDEVIKHISSDIHVIIILMILITLISVFLRNCHTRYNLANG